MFTKFDGNVTFWRQSQMYSEIFCENLSRNFTHVERRNDWSAAAAVARRVMVSGWRMPWSHASPASTRPTVLEIPALEMRKAARAGATPLAMAMSGRWV